MTAYQRKIQYRIKHTRDYSHMYPDGQYWRESDKRYRQSRFIATLGSFVQYTDGILWFAT